MPSQLKATDALIPTFICSHLKNYLKLVHLKAIFLFSLAKWFCTLWFCVLGKEWKGYWDFLRSSCSKVIRVKNQTLLQYLLYSKCTISNTAFMKRQCIVLSISENKILNNNHFIINFDLCAFAQFPFYATCKQTVNLGNSWNASNRLTLLQRAAPGRGSRFRHYHHRKGRQWPFLGSTFKHIQQLLF